MFSSKSRVERRIVRCYWDDGLIDILSGLGILLIGIAWQCDLVPLGAVVPAMLIPFWRPLRKRITEPRLGSVEFSDAQEGRQRSFLLWSIAAGCLAFGLCVGIYFTANSGAGEFSFGPWIAAMPACLIGGLAVAVSLLILVPRFVGYGLVFVAAGVAVVLLDRRPGVAIIAGGIVATLVGLLRLVTFLRSHSPQTLEANGA